MTHSVEPIRLETVAAYDLWSATYDNQPNALVVLERRFAIPRLDPQPQERVLDAGCGTGDHLVALRRRGSVPIGLDVSLGMLRRVEGKAPGVPLVAASLTEGLPFAPGVFDAVLCSLVSDHLTDLDRFFSEIRRTLRTRGRLVMTGLHPERIAAGLSAGFTAGGRRYRVDANPHTLGGFAAAAGRSGLEVVDVEEVPVDDVLVSAVPRVAELHGENLLFVMQARRPLAPSGRSG